MTEFHYKGVDDQGDQVQGSMEEQSAHRVTMKLQERGYTVSTVEAVNKSEGLVNLSRQLTWEELDFLSHELYSLTRSNLPLPESIKALARDAHKPRLKSVLDSLGDDLERGQSLDAALEEVQGQVPPLFTHVVRAGEQANNLPGILQLLSGYTRQVLSLRQNIYLALAYPLATLLAGSLVVLFVLIKVVPTFGEIFREFGAGLPPTTQSLLFISNTLLEHSTILLSALIGGTLFLVIAYLTMRRTESGRHTLDWIRLRLPVAGALYRLSILVRFCQTLRILLLSRVPMHESLNLAAAATGSTVLQSIAGQSSAQVAAGETLAQALSSNPFFGRDLCWLVASGESNTLLEEALEHAGDKLMRQLDMQYRSWMGLANPAFLLGIGFILVYIVTALYQPIFTLGDAISGT